MPPYGSYYVRHWFYIDLDEFDYKFVPIKFEWGLKFDVELSNKDLMNLLIKAALQENECIVTIFF